MKNIFRGLMFSSPNSNRSAYLIAVIVSLLLLLLVFLLGNGTAAGAAGAAGAAAATGAASDPVPRAQSTSIPLYLPGIWVQAPAPSPGAAPAPWGLVFANSAETHSGADRIQRAVDAGAAFDRFPFYWPNIERTAGRFDWSTQDAAVAADESRGLRVLPILLSTPGQYYPAGAEPARYAAAPPVGGSFLRNQGRAGGAAACSQPGPPAPRDLYAPVFADGTDQPGPGKTINSGNPWARFVYQTVERFRPGGSGGHRVRHWEIWNEPDLCQFWSGSATEYARLLKVAYLAAKHSDPAATVLWGGLATYENPGFLDTLISTLRADPGSAQYGGFFDAAAAHHYSIAWNGYLWTKRIRAALDGAGWAQKPIWITESGVPVCDDYPGPSCPSPWRARPEEQAAYIWQNVGYTRLAGGGPIFQFNLHDDCGNVVARNSPDGFGLLKNESSSYCSPDGAEARLSYTAYRLAVQYFGSAELLWSDTQDGVVQRFAFYEPASRERRLLAFALTGGGQTARIPATGTAARQVALDGSAVTLLPDGNEYHVPVPGATNRNWPNAQGGYDIGIYGKPYLVIERDTLPPEGGMQPLPSSSPPSFQLTWEVGDLGSGVAGVVVWYRAGEGSWQLWRSNLPALGSATFAGQPEQHYLFAALGLDRAGNTVAEPVTQAETWTTSG